MFEVSFREAAIAAELMGDSLEHYEENVITITA